MNLPPKSPPAAPGPGGFKRTVPKPAPGTINVGLTAVSNSYMMAKLGKPRESFSADCQPITNPKLKGSVEVATVGPLKVQGLKPAVASLREVLADI